jgi:hypothetical protein
MLVGCVVVIMKTETSIHRVAKIEIGERRFHASSTSPFWCRSITVTDEDGHSHTLELYSHSEDEDTALKVTS